MSFEFLDHTGDTAVRLRAGDEADLFREATRATLAVYLGESLEWIRPDRARKDASAAGGPEGGVRLEREAPIELEAEDGESLLVDYLNELVYLFDTERFLVADLDVDRLEVGAPSVLVGRLRGDTLDPERHRISTEIKAATFHDLRIRRRDGGLEAVVVFDL